MIVDFIMRNGMNYLCYDRYPLTYNKLSETENSLKGSSSIYRHSAEIIAFEEEE